MLLQRPDREGRVAPTPQPLQVGNLPAVTASNRRASVAPFIEQAAIEAAATARRDDAKVFLREFTRELLREIKWSTKIGAFFCVAILIGGVLYLGGWIKDWLVPVVGKAPEHELPFPAIVFSIITVAVVAVGVAIAWLTVGKRPIPSTAPTDVSFVTRAARNDLYGDAINDTLVVEPGKALTRGLVTADRSVVDGLFTGGAALVRGTGQGLRRAQNGFVRSYALSILAGVVIVLAALLVVNL